jgi:hypothetical protein
LPESVESEATRHHWITLEMAGEQPIQTFVSGNFQLGDNLSFAMCAACFGNRCNAVDHQHWRQRELGVTRPKQLATRTGQQILKLEARTAFRHAIPLFMADPAMRVHG